MTDKIVVVRDRRNRGWFWMDNEYLNGYARYYGAIGTAIYVSLCRHAHIKDQVAFPSQALMAAELGNSERTIIRYLKKFETYGLISVEKNKNPVTKQFASNVYMLLDKSNWKKPYDTQSYGRVTQDAKSHVTQSHTKETHRERDSIERKRIKLLERARFSN